MFLLPGGAEKALFDAINAANPSLPVPLTPDDLYLGKIAKVEGGTGEVSIPTVAFFTSLYEGYRRFEYNRIDFGKVFGTIKPQIARVGFPTLFRLLPIINEELGLTLTERDVVDVPITWLGANEQVNILVITSENSLGYEGQFLIEYTRLRPEIHTAVLERSLEVLAHPVSPTLGKRSLSMMMYSLDFTKDDPKLKITNGLWANLNVVRQVMSQHGFDNWPQATTELLFRSTGQVPGSNKAFTHVIIQKDPDIPGHAGDALFHLNR